MNKIYTVPHETNSKPELTKGFFLQDFYFLLGYMAISGVLRGFVHPRLHIIFFAFSFLMAFFLTCKSTYNRKRRNYESIIIMLRKDCLTYKPIIKMDGR